VRGARPPHRRAAELEGAAAEREPDRQVVALIAMARWFVGLSCARIRSRWRISGSVGVGQSATANGRATCFVLFSKRLFLP
jgi:hypothetical protein